MVWRGGGSDEPVRSGIRLVSAACSVAGLHHHHEATIVSFILAASLGLVLALMRRSGPLLICGGVIGLVEFIRSTPLLVQIFFIYFMRC